MSQQGPLVSVDIGEALEKLVETVGGALGAGYEPKRIQRKAEAEAQALVRMAKAEAQAAIIQAEANIRVRDLESRAEARLKQQELRRQRTKSVKTLWSKIG
jgi:Skp family chaperone for outer membrane proteins